MDVAGAKTMRGQVFYKDNYFYTCTYVRKKSEQPLDSAFAAIIEPYVGKPFVTGVRRWMWRATTPTPAGP